MYLPRLIVNDRRDFLRKSASLVIVGSSFSLSSLFAAEDAENPIITKKSKEKIISVERGGVLHRIPIADSNNKIIKDGYEMLSRVFGDYRAGVAIPMDLNLFAILYGAQNYLAKNGYSKPYYLTSGYRTRLTNSLTEGAAQNSKHPDGKAFDGVFPGISPLETGKILRYSGARGIGIYDTFCHADTGMVRAWFGTRHG